MPTLSASSSVLMLKCTPFCLSFFSTLLWIRSARLAPAVALMDGDGAAEASAAALMAGVPGGGGEGGVGFWAKAPSVRAPRQMEPTSSVFINLSLSDGMQSEGRLDSKNSVSQLFQRQGRVGARQGRAEEPREAAKLRKESG